MYSRRMPQNFKYHLQSLTILPFVFKIYAPFNKPDRKCYSETYRTSNPQLARIKHQRDQAWRYTSPFPSFQMIARVQYSSISIFRFRFLPPLFQPWSYLSATLSVHNVTVRQRLNHQTSFPEFLKDWYYLLREI